MSGERWEGDIIGKEADAKMAEIRAAYEARKALRDEFYHEMASADYMIDKVADSDARFVLERLRRAVELLAQLTIGGA